jgi:glycosyltransferase involved in cell wall biosynthesis
MRHQVSVIIPTHNGENRISRCLEALLEQRTSHAYEIIVVDDGSTDQTAEVVGSYPSVKLIPQKQAGPAGARNNGVKNACGDVILFTDDDCVPLNDWIDKMVRPFDDPETVGSKGVYLTAQKELISRFIQQEYEEKYERLSKSDGINLVDTYSAGFRREIFLKIGGYDESFAVPSVEDRDFSYKLWTLGYKMVFVPEAKVYHTHAAGLWNYTRKKFKNGYWGVMSMMKYPGTIANASDTPLTQKVQVILAGLIAPGILLPIFGSWGLGVLGLLSAAFLVSSAPLTIRCLRADAAVTFAAPFFILCRAVGFAGGMFTGVVTKFRDRYK